VLASSPSMSSPHGAMDDDDLVRSIAVRTMTSLGMKDAIEEAIQVGYQALLEARESFDAEKGVGFEAHAAYRIRLGVLEGVRKMSALPPKVHRLRKAMAAADAAAEAAGETRGRRGEPSRAASALGALEALMNNLATVYTAAEVAEAAQNGGTEDSLVKEMDIARLKRALTKLPEKERDMLRAVYYDGMSVGEASPTLRLSRAQGYRLHADALTSLRALLV
jgi:RNA polymerase sigma factor FliA